ncbi:cytochrome c oxidase assembly protein [Inquilinus sp. Marseille-Q2685]|uniref:cytochrome c oxidase assembly protein n=1 Tax=Inquilinus sp. Marseille-Q2685 TaxID=2866581 RepID=UPI001CE460A4|nr:cytochrome c oxidase assembly protein [Inquilinus sp. Marseille-Q2685]
MKRFSLAVVILLMPPVALAHAGHDHGMDYPWTWDPWVTGPLLLTALLYAGGVARLWRRAGPGRGVGSGQTAMFAAGWLALAVALVTPLHALGERLFTAHMVEHEVLMVLAAPLLVLSRPIGAMLWGLPQGWRRSLGAAAGARVWRRCWWALTDPLTATVLHGIAIWAWHVPALFAAALADEGMHALQHASFLVTALLFWWSLLCRRGSRAAAIGHLFATALHTGLLGALLVFSTRVWFPDQAGEAARWGLTALEDQQLAGLVMWIPACLAYPVAGLALAGLWIAGAGRRAGEGRHAVGAR